MLLLLLSCTWGLTVQEMTFAASAGGSYNADRARVASFASALCAETSEYKQ